MSETASTNAISRSGRPTLWYALFGGASAWFVGLCAGYFIVTPSCAAGSELYLHGVSLLTAATGAGAAVVGTTLWRRSDHHRPDDGGGRRDRTKFIAAVGAVLSGLFTLVMLMQWLGVAIHGPCESQPRLHDSPDAYLQPGLAECGVSCLL